MLSKAATLEGIDEVLAELDAEIAAEAAEAQAYAEWLARMLSAGELVEVVIELHGTDEPEGHIGT